MKFVKPAIALAAALTLLLWIILGGQGRERLRERQSRSQALAAAAPEKITARYVLEQAPYGGAAEAPDTEALSAVLLQRGWVAEQDRKALPIAWSPATKKWAFFRHGWVWIGDESGKTLKTIWYEPDLKADGKLEWSLDGTQLRLHADGWRRWLNLDLELN